MSDPTIELDRRRFLGTAAGIGAGLGVGALAHGKTAENAAQPEFGAVPPPPMVTLGNTGIRTTRLAQGTGVAGGNRQSNQTRLGFEKFVSLIHHAYNRGVRFFDLADLYGTHLYFREALRTIPRDEVTILSKLWWRYDGPEANTSAAFREQVTKSALERFCHELSTDRVDIVLLHCLMDAKWPEQMKPYRAALEDAKSRGQLKAMGVSCHDFGALKTAAQTEWVEVILARTNPEGVKMDASPAEVEAVLADAHAAGKTIIGMKIIGEGQLADDRDRCIKYAQGHDWLDAMTIGFEKPEQIDDILRLLAKHPAVNA
ncbi:aldo/keto reductase [Botrimarina mediterranea]|uniref:aldo/keto reductase n=1 Tax=Botrimarina mediterranea TaxID=2528022 RepID=UPI00118818CF|nr:putative oxidoreductase [Planctomycetes bacterium K2D]